MVATCSIKCLNFPRGVCTIEANESRSPSFIVQGYRLFRQGLDLFLNGGGLNHRCRLLSPTSTHVRLEVSQWLASVTSFCNRHGLPLAQLLGKASARNGHWSVRSMADALCRMHDFLSHSSVPEVELQKIDISGRFNVDYLDQRRRDGLELLAERVKTISDFCLGYYLHGSAADATMTSAYSDVDTLLIVRDEVFASSDALIELRRRCILLLPCLFSVDPLQHHGHFSMTESELHAYCQGRFLPFSLFRDAVPLYGRAHLLIHEFADSSDSHPLHGLSVACQNWCENGLPLKDLYHLKSATSLIQLFPVLYLQAQGINVSKRESFSLARQDFSEEEWAPIDIATSVRCKWPSPPLMLKSMVPLLQKYGSPWAIHYLARLTYWRVPHQLESMLGDDLAARMKSLIDISLKRTGFNASNA